MTDKTQINPHEGGNYYRDEGGVLHVIPDPTPAPTPEPTAAPTPAPTKPALKGAAANSTTSPEE